MTPIPGPAVVILVLLVGWLAYEVVRAWYTGAVVEPLPPGRCHRCDAPAPMVHITPAGVDLCCLEHGLRAVRHGGILTTRVAADTVTLGLGAGR